MPAVESSSSLWSREQDKQFEKAIAAYPEDSSDRWEKIAAEVSGKSVEEIKQHYELLVDDVSRIESGFVEVPCYNSTSDGSSTLAGDDGAPKKGANFSHLNEGGGKSSRSDQERRKGIAWTEDEHRSFSTILPSILSKFQSTIEIFFTTLETSVLNLRVAFDFFGKDKAMEQESLKPNITLSILHCLIMMPSCTIFLPFLGFD